MPSPHIQRTRVKREVSLCSETSTNIYRTTWCQILWYDNLQAPFAFLALSIIDLQGHDLLLKGNLEYSSGYKDRSVKLAFHLHQTHPMIKVKSWGSRHFSKSLFSFFLSSFTPYGGFLVSPWPWISTLNEGNNGRSSPNELHFVFMKMVNGYNQHDFVLCK